MQDLSGKVAVVTGAASGIGRALAGRFARAGMKLALADIEGGPLAETAKALEFDGAEVLAEIVDVADADAMDDFAATILDRFDAVHVVCNNAGVGSGGRMWELTTKDWEFAMRPNLWGVIHGVRVFGKHLVEQNEGHIVNTASMAGLVSVPGLGPYNVTKHAVVALSETLAGELGEAGSAVGVSVLCPGFVNTRIWDADRSRPVDLQNPDTSTEELEQLKALLRGLIEAGLSPDHIADRVHDAILDGEFYVVTHESTLPEVERRMRAILDGGPPAIPTGGPLTFTK